jgi:hypothetical protein
MEGIDISWKKVNGGEAIEKMVNDISASFDFLHPENSVKGLVQLYKALNAMPAGYWRNKKLDETRQLIEAMQWFVDRCFYNGTICSTNRFDQAQFSI